MAHEISMVRNLQGAFCAYLCHSDGEDHKEYCVRYVSCNECPLDEPMTKKELIKYMNKVGIKLTE